MVVHVVKKGSNVLLSFGLSIASGEVHETHSFVNVANECGVFGGAGEALGGFVGFVGFVGDDKVTVGVGVGGEATHFKL